MSEKKEYIERGAFADYLREQAKMDMRRMIYHEGIIAMMNAQPAADVEPVVRGGWKEDGAITRCSVCGEHKEFPHWTHCPNCGAHMMERSGSGE